MSSLSCLRVKLALAAFLLWSLPFAMFDVAPAQTQETKQPSAQTLPDFVQLSKKLAPIVVNISATQRAKGRPPEQDPFGGTDPFSEFWRRFFGEPPGGPQVPFFRQAVGSGFIIDDEGLIVTNNHVVEDAEKIMVRLPDGSSFDAKMVGRDAKTDLAVVRISVPKGKLPKAPLGDSDRLQVGEWVLAMGSPFGLENTVTAGIVSAKGRYLGAGPYDDFIQTDASINPGNSGGPLINLRGEVVGISTAIFSRSGGGNLGIGFAIPINLAKEILPELIKKGKVTRGWLGVSIQRVTPEIAEALGMKDTRGALVASVMQGSPAETAGIKPGDVIVEYNGKKIEDSNQLPILVARTPVGDTVKLTLLREKKVMAVTAKISELKEEQFVAAGPETGDLGMTLQNVTPETAESLGLERPGGVVITAVEPNSSAAEAGLRRGDVILEVNRQRINNLDDYGKTVKSAKAGENLLFLIRRGQTNLFLALRAPQKRG